MGAYPSGDALFRNPITGTGCCERAIGGHAAAAAPRSVMNLRRCMCCPLRTRLVQCLSVAICDRAESENRTPPDFEIVEADSKLWVIRDGVLPTHSILVNH